MPLNPITMGAAFKQALEDHKNRVQPTSPTQAVSDAVMEASLLQMCTDIATAVTNGFIGQAVVQVGSATGTIIS